MASRRMVCGAAVAATLLAGLLPASANNDHDGVWKITTSAETGKCGTNYDFQVSVKNGKVSYAGLWPVKATGGINAVGLVNMNIAHSGKKVTAKGLVRGDHASGDWSSPNPDCTGSWFAKKA